MVDAIYIHIPFCIKKCYYCDFLSFANHGEVERKKYVDYLVREILLYPKNKYDTIYFGGGTPSILEPSDIEKILEVLDFDETAEITLEVNPKTADRKKLSELKKIGINRLSIGVQSFDNKFLKILGREHDSQEAVKIYRTAREVGFKNISLDLMFSLPTQNISDLKSDLEKLFELEPEHFSIYSLTWEEGTKFQEKLLAGEFFETENDIEADMYSFIIQSATKKNYSHYEISNFCKKNFEARHNSKYWKNMEYIGVGLGASGYFLNERYKNFEQFFEFYGKIDINEKPISEIEVVNDDEKESYKNILGLRLLNRGVIPHEKFREKFLELEKEGYLLKKFVAKENTKNISSENIGDKNSGENISDYSYVLSTKGIFFA
ncbi:MAG: radical SAM family heme chaperone HemW, partial [Fusobacteriaceae bacterium]